MKTEQVCWLEWRSMELRKMEGRVGQHQAQPVEARMSGASERKDLCGGVGHGVGLC